MAGLLAVDLRTFKVDAGSARTLRRRAMIQQRRAMGKPVYFEGSAPILRVEDMAASLHFYVNLLGFNSAAWGNDDFTNVSRDGAGIYLCRGGQGRGGAWVWIGVEDAEKLHEECKARGVAIRLPPTNYSWALEMQVEDPDGNVLRLGSEPKPAGP